MKKYLRSMMIFASFVLSASAHAGLLGSALTHEAFRETNYSYKSNSAPVDLPPADQGFAPCADQFPNAKPLNPGSVNAQWQVHALCANHFAVLYSSLSKTPLVVTEKLSRVQMGEASGEERTENFFADPRLAGVPRSELSDYRGSGYDRGHMSPAGDQPDPVSMAQSFCLCNMIPQDPTNNRKIWSKIESDVRKYARRAQGDVFVFSGPIFDNGHATIGRGEVWVPTRLFKLVYDPTTGRAWAYILDNTSTAIINKPIDYPQFVQVTGWNLLPSNVH